MTEANDVSARNQLLEIAKWPEREFVWDTECWEGAVWADGGAHPIHGERTEQEQMADVATRDETIPPEAPSRQVHAGGREDGNNRARIAGGITAGLLLIGAGISEYEMPPIPVPVSHAVAMNAPRGMAVPRTADPPVMAGLQVPITPSPAASGAMPPPPSSRANSPDGDAPSAGQNQRTQSSLRRPRHGMQLAITGRADNSNGKPRLPGTVAADDPIDAPMTLTPETAPPQQQPGPRGQTAAR